MKTAIVCYYADLGRPYLPLIERMAASARAAMPDARLALLTPSAGCEAEKFFDDTYPIDSPTDADNLCLEKARAISSWIINGPDCRTIFTDPDIEFRQRVEFDGTWDVGLLWRRRKPDQPVNTGLILSDKRRLGFWEHYGRIAANLPYVLRYWWADQLPFSLLTGVCHNSDDRLLVDDARIWLMDGARYCPTSDEAHDDAWAIHYKGIRKGEGWKEIYRPEDEAA